MLAEQYSKMTVEQIVDLLKEADNAYYGAGESTLTDRDYDEIKDHLSNIAPGNSYLAEVGAEPIEDTHWEKHIHEYPLGSLAKVNSIEELCEWASAENYVVQPKLDGISICLTYEGGKLIHAVTRGKDGVGDDITRNVLKMQGVPHQITTNKKTVVRGEIVLYYEDFERLPIESRGKNPRNTAAGAAKKLSGDLCSYLTVIVYDFMNAKDHNCENEYLANTALIKCGFPYVVENHYCAGGSSLSQTIENLEQKRGEFRYDIDGLVIKNNNINFIDEWARPKNKIAYKFAHQAATTYLQNIEWATSGERVNPVAILRPVDIAGVTVSRASLHNIDYIKQLMGERDRIFVDQPVEVTRRNDVIPQVECFIDNNETNENEDAISWEPLCCPTCGGEVEQPENADGKQMAWFVCTNPTCSAKAIKNVLKWFEAHDCKGVAEKTVELIHEYFGFDTLTQFIELVGGGDFGNIPATDEQLTSLPGMGKSKLNTIREQIRHTKNTTNNSKFFGGLNIAGFSIRSFNKIGEYIKRVNKTCSWSDIIEYINDGKIAKIEGFSDKSQNSLKKQILNLEPIISKLVEFNIEPETEAFIEPVAGGIAGSSFCFTGSLDTMKRKDAQALVESKGGTVKGSVSSGLDYLVTNTPESGSAKNKKAQGFGTKLITEQEFIDLIG